MLNRTCSTSMTQNLWREGFGDKSCSNSNVQDQMRRVSCNNMSKGGEKYQIHTKKQCKLIDSIISSFEHYQLYLFIRYMIENKNKECIRSIYRLIIFYIYVFCWVDHLFPHDNYCIVLYVSETIGSIYLSPRIKFYSYFPSNIQFETYFSPIIELDSLISVYYFNLNHKPLKVDS